MFTDDITSIVVDCGSHHIRAGFSGEDTPKYFNESKVGRTPDGVFCGD